MTSNKNEKELLTVILNQCGVCYDCGVKDWNVELTYNRSRVCPICWNIVPNVMEECMKQALNVYGGWSYNKFSNESPTISNVYLPFLQLTQYAVQCAIKTQTITTTTTTTTKVGKDWIKQVLLEMEQRHTIQKTDEDGCMSYHVVPTPPSIFISSLTNYIPSLQSLSSSSLPNRKKKRRRFRGNDPTLKQGGHARENLELRIQQTSFTNVPIMQHFIESNSSIVHTILQNILNNNQYQEELAKWIQSCAITTTSSEQTKNSHIYVAAWRHAFYIKGEYTKHGTNISQTPFYVPDSNGEMIKKGTTSIEEEICPQVVKWGCQGISTQNNSPLFPDIVYGMCKFHASGREDINVRMFYSPPGINNNKQDKIIGGRPFVCKVMDAHRIPTSQQLQTIVHAVNHTNKEDTIENNHNPKMTSDGCNGGINNNPNFYGCNPNGVGISSKLEFCSDLNFRNLQSDTEQKVKYYGCYCWSQKPIVNLKEQLLLPSIKFPLEIQQKTPLRVLHRRSSMNRTRIIHDIHSFEQIDNHHFILHLSTSAGTYVKEFVHGDCGRTIPSISSILQCKTDILQLDCEGVAIE